MSRACASRARRMAGFTLLEVMLAFVVLATAMGLLLGMLSNGLQQVRQAQGETEAALHAQSLLDQLGVLEPLEPGRRDGEFADGRYRYQLEITEAEDPAALPPAPDQPPPAQAPVGGPVLYRVALAVSWGSEGPPQRLSFVTLRARTPQLTAMTPP